MARDYVIQYGWLFVDRIWKIIYCELGGETLLQKIYFGRWKDVGMLETKYTPLKCIACHGKDKEG